MTIRLTVRTALWRSHVASVVNAVDDLIPVVKGNGYGFGRKRLAEIASEFTDTVAVGTIHELAALPSKLTGVVLTPTLSPPDDAASEATGPVLTVASIEHVEALRDWGGRVVVKLDSPMQRFGGTTELVGPARAAGLHVVGVSIHPPLAGTDHEHVAAITAHLPYIEPDLDVWISHLSPSGLATLPASHRYRLRLGTLLWHGDKSALRLDADVLAVRAVVAGEKAGYRLGTIAYDGHLVMVGAGTANGVAMIDEGHRSLSPFHFERRRLVLHEAPHMHTSMAFVPAGDPLPDVGQHVDLQRPLHMTTVDEYRWL